MKCTPATYIASLYRQILMKEPLETVFTGNSRLLKEFQEKMGIQINWQELLTKEETYFYSGYYQSRSLFFFGFYLLKCLAGENKGILERK